MIVSISLACLLIALAIDALVGDPPWLWRRVPHPAVLLGRLVDRLDDALNREADPEETRRRNGVIALVILLAAGAVIGVVLHVAALTLPFGIVIEILAIAVLLAQRDLADHVRAVADALDRAGLEGGRAAVAKLVGRDPDSLDEAGVSRAAIESLAENFSDGVVAPAFWYVILGLPGLIAYKMLNTADSMIGHKTERHAAFGRATARVDDIANLPASRLAALLISNGALFMISRDAWQASTEAVHGSARKHRSPNAGWPESAMAGALGIALAGPRTYAGQTVDDPWMNPDGRKAVEARDIRRALRLYRRAVLLLAALIAILAALAAGMGI